MRTTTLILSAALLLAGIGSASACSLSNVDVAVTGDGDVVELVDNGDGNQITGRVRGNYHALRGKLEGSCNAIVTRQDGRFTRVGLVVDGNRNGIAVLLAGGAVVDIDSSGNGNQILINALGGRYHVRSTGTGNVISVTSGGQAG